MVSATVPLLQVVAAAAVDIKVKTLREVDAAVVAAASITRLEAAAEVVLNQKPRKAAEVVADLRRAAKAQSCSDTDAGQKKEDIIEIDID